MALLLLAKSLMIAPVFENTISLWLYGSQCTKFLPLTFKSIGLFAINFFARFEHKLLVLYSSIKEIWLFQTLIPLKPNSFESAKEFSSNGAIEPLGKALSNALAITPLPVPPLSDMIKYCCEEFSASIHIPK